LASFVLAGLVTRKNSEKKKERKIFHIFATQKKGAPKYFAAMHRLLLLAASPLLAAAEFASPLVVAEYIDGKVPVLEYTRARAASTLVPAPRDACDVEPASASASAGVSLDVSGGHAEPPRTVTAACALASIPAVDRNGDYTANITVAGSEPADHADRADRADRVLFLPRAAKGAELTLFPTAPCGASARFGDGGKADPIDGQCNVELAVHEARGDLLRGGARLSLVAAAGDAIQDWRDTPAPTRDPQFRVYDEEWAVGCLGLGDALWECYSLVPSRRDRAGDGVPLAPGWSVDRHGEVLVEKRLRRGEIDWRAPVPLCDVPVFDAAAEARAHPGRPLHELFSERYRREGAQTPVLIVNDPADAEFAAMDLGIRPDQILDEDNLGALLFRSIDFATMKRSRMYNRLRSASYHCDFFNETSVGALGVAAFPPYPDPVCLRDPGIAPHINTLTGVRGEVQFFARNAYRFGGSGTSTNFHAHRASWTRLHGGAKVWFFYPPKSKSATRAMVSTVDVLKTWLLRNNLDPDMPKHPVLNFTYAQSLREGVPPKVCIQRAGTFMYVGDDWLSGHINIGLVAGIENYSQVVHPSEKDAIPDGANPYLAEYPMPGHTVRSMPTE
jgi:hypothetical protein